MHPFIKLMKLYCVDYTNSHDTTWLPKIMTEDYVVHIAGHDLHLSGSYKPDVEKLFGVAPGLSITVHELYCNGDRVALRFSEHACFTDKGNALATWRGYSTYTWNGTRLTECWVEQDFYSRHRQIKSGIPHLPQPPALDAWMTPVVPEDASALSVARHWLERFDLSEVGAHSIDDEDDTHEWELALQPETVHIRDIFSAGREVPFHAVVTGPLATDPMRRVDLAVCGVITVGKGDTIEKVSAVFDRFSVRIARR